jgi:AcrR family transcriptional regulator
MDAGLELMGRKGLGGTSSNEIARAAGVSIGTFYSYFRDKRSLFLAILKSHLDTFVTDIYSPDSPGSTPMTRLISDHISKAFDVFDRQPDFHRQALVMKFIDDDVQRLFGEVEQRQMDIISRLLEHYVKPVEGRDLKAAAKVIHGAVENAAHAIRFLSSPFSREEFVLELTEMIRSYVEGMR